MKFMNTWDIESARTRWRDHPILGPATQTLANLEDWTYAHSDGWAYWPKPARAAAKLMELIEPSGNPRARYDDDREDVTLAAYKAALVPIRAFRTRQNGNFDIVEAS